MTEFATQVILRDAQGGTMVSWIPSEHAIVGKKVRLKLGEGELSSAMTVQEVYTNQQPWAWIWDRSRDWTRTRRASDI